MSISLLFYIFFKVGLFTIGGGLASLGLLHEYLVDAGFISSDVFYNMFAISQSTPGPIGVNMATYVGYEYYGVFGSIIATFALVLPSFIIITVIAYSLKNFVDNRFVEAAFSGFRPAAMAIILSVAYMLFTDSVLQLSGDFTISFMVIIKCIIFISGLVASLKYRVHPLIIVALGGVAGGIFL